MTFKELVDFTGKSERTVRNWIKKAGCAKTAQGYASDYSLDEIELILQSSSMSKDAVSILMDNARKPTQIITVKENNNPMAVMMDFMVKMQEQQQQFMNTVIDRLEAKEQKQLSLPVAPDIEPRAYLNQLVREYSQLKKVDFRTGWSVLYTEFLYRCKTNIKVKAKNEGIKPIDYLERESLLLTGCSIMKGLIDG